MSASRGEHDAAVAQAAAAVVDHLSGRLNELTQSVQHMLLDEVAELGVDAQMVDLLRDTVEANIETVLSTIRHEIPLEHFKPPTAALEHARRLAQRGVSVNALVRAYRLGHKAVLVAVREEIRASNLDLHTGLDVDSQIAEATFTYIDWISQQVVATYQDEHDRWLENRNNMRALRVREILDGGDVDADAVGAAILYPLRGTHLAVILWRVEPTGGDELVAMERFVQDFAKSVGVRERTLFVPVDRRTGRDGSRSRPSATPRWWRSCVLSQRHGPTLPLSPSATPARMWKVSAVPTCRPRMPVPSHLHWAPTLRALLLCLIRAWR